MAHGTRAAYQAGCRCETCKRANAQYSTALRLLIAKGGVPLGRKIPATDARRHVRSLLAEDFTIGQLAERCGARVRLLEPSYRAHHPRVTVRTHLRIQRVWRQECFEFEDQ